MGSFALRATLGNAFTSTLFDPPSSGHQATPVIHPGSILSLFRIRFSERKKPVLSRSYELICFCFCFQNEVRGEETAKIVKIF
jgi:hypothetical protein